MAVPQEYRRPWPWNRYIRAPPCSLRYVVQRNSNGVCIISCLRLMVDVQDFLKPQYESEVQRTSRDLLALKGFYIDMPIVSPTEAGTTVLPPCFSPRGHLEPGNIEWAQEQIQSCIWHQHEIDKPDFVPKRLMRVDGDELFLVESVSNAETKCYAALTYCWGPKEHARKQLKTYRRNLKEHQRDISELQLPAVVQNAVSVTRALSIPYLWVDALCILQDDIKSPDHQGGSDWDEQCKHMGDIYGGAYVTIAAAASENCEEGFLNRMKRVLVPFRFKDGSTPISFGIHPRFINESIDNELTWATRGWTFQERLTSTRLLLFGPNRVHFQCPHSIGGTWGSEDSPMLNTTILRQLQNPYLIWAMIAEDFSQRGLKFTLATDVLPSLSGIARLFQERLEDDYLAGHWKGDLHQSLIWTLDESRTENLSYQDILEQLKHPHQYLAPSWSWIGQPSGVQFDLRLSRQVVSETRPECDIIDACVSVQGDNPLGQVTGGYLEMSARIFEWARGLSSDMPRDPVSDWFSLGREDEYLLDFKPDCNLAESCQGESRPNPPIGFLLIGSGVFAVDHIVSVLLHGRIATYHAHGGTTECDEWMGETIAEISNRSPGATKNRTAYGLMITPAESLGEFYRVGAFISMYREAGGLRLFESCEKQTVRVI
ncbi:heterokaryon incompatibility protein-domain-containing protein [Dactylonectria macrodidyma]|uniref:Heterokaryon incompatibility protein-domain-containing protein n=1 Tax=Dactylonectria macrodidyma TaxID=307937 RepID=A0A9P9FL58_9HYPO|nr:heterokaryon incompatibility protein-domain-containing protein [Dactylonectria macrodidyma]